jgi:hypothetical protein
MTRVRHDHCLSSPVQERAWQQALEQKKLQYLLYAFYFSVLFGVL